MHPSYPTSALRQLFNHLTLLAWLAAGPASLGQNPSSFTPLAPEEVAGNIGVFIGVGQFESKGMDLPGPPNDAATLAHVFVNELKIVPPQRAFVIVGGDLTPQSAGYLRALQSAGVSVGTSATKARILEVIRRAVALPYHPNALVFVTISTHGCEVNGDPYVLPADGANTVDSLINLKSEVRDTLGRFSGTARQIVISDACRSEQGGGGGGRGLRTPMALPRSNLTRAALAGLKADVLVGACASGQMSLDSGEFRMGVFTKTLVDALRGQGVVSGGEFLTVGQVLTLVSVEAERAAGEIYRRSPEGSVVRKGVDEMGLPRPWFQGEISALNLPLARTAEGLATQGASARRAARVIERLQETVRRQPALFAAADRTGVAQLETALAKPTARDDSVFVAELDLALDPTSASKTREALTLIRRFVERENQRAALTARIDAIRRQSSGLDPASLGAWKRLGETVAAQPPSAAGAFFVELESRLGAAADTNSASVLAWWTGWDRDQRRTRLLERAAQAKERCAPTVESHLAGFLDLTQRVRTAQAGADALFDELEVRLDPNNCVFVEATLAWWNDRVFDERRQRAASLLQQAAAANPSIAPDQATVLQDLRGALERWAAPRLEAVLAVIEPRLGSLTDADGLRSLLTWWSDQQRQTRRTYALVLLEAAFSSGLPSASDASPLRQLGGTLAKAQGPRLDRLLNEFERRFDPQDAASLSATAAWWSAYRLRERRDAAIELTGQFQARSLAADLPGRVASLTNALATLPPAEVEPLLDQLEQHLSPGELATLQTVLGWYERNFVQAPTWDVYVATPAAGASTPPSAELADAIVKQLRSRARSAQLTLGPAVPDVKEESAINPLCRRLSAKAVLLVQVLSLDARTSQSASLGPLVTAEVVLEVTAVRPGRPLTPRQYRGEYKDVANRRDAAMRTAVSRAVTSMGADADLMADLGL